MNTQELQPEQLELPIEATPLTPEQEKEIAADLLVADNRFVNIIQFDKLENNSVLIFRIAEDNLNLIMALPLLCEKYKDILKAKNTAILIVSPDENVELLNEDKMRQMGWVRQEQKRIITLS